MTYHSIALPEDLNFITPEWSLSLSTKKLEAKEPPTVLELRNFFDFSYRLKISLGKELDRAPLRKVPKTFYLTFGKESSGLVSKTTHYITVLSSPKDIPPIISSGFWTLDLPNHTFYCDKNTTIDLFSSYMWEKYHVSPEVQNSRKIFLGGGYTFPATFSLTLADKTYSLTVVYRKLSVPKTPLSISRWLGF